MHIEKFVKLLVLADTFALDASDLIILYDVGIEPDGEATIMKIVKKPGTMSKATRHERVKRLCARGFLVKKEVPNNMRKKTLELSDMCMDFLKQFETVGA